MDNKEQCNLRLTIIPLVVAHKTQTYLLATVSVDRGQAIVISSRRAVHLVVRIVVIITVSLYARRQ